MVKALREPERLTGDEGRCSVLIPASGDVLTNVLAGLIHSSESYGQQ